MGSFDGTEICELVGLYLLNKLSKLLGNENMGLYRDDRVPAIKTASDPILDKMRENIITPFKEEGPTITYDTSLTETDFVDVTFSLERSKFFPFKKPNNVPLYINVKANHRSTILKDLSKMINKRLSELSCNKGEFDKVKLLYEKSLQESGY